MQPRLDVKPLIEKVASLVESRQEDPCIKWYPDWASPSPDRGDYSGEIRLKDDNRRPQKEVLGSPRKALGTDLETGQNHSDPDGVTTLDDLKADDPMM